MTAAPDEGPRRRRPRERLLLGLARLALIVEDLWPRALPALGVIAVFLTVALLDILPALPGWLHGLVLLAFVGAVLVALGRAPEGHPLTDDAVKRRLERDSGLANNPLGTLDDTLANGGDPIQRALWRVHLARAGDQVRALRVALPSPGMARHDPRGLRALVLFCLIVGLVVGWGDPGERLDRAFRPGGGTAGAGVAAADLWVTPPAYTGAPPMFLDQTRGEHLLEVPEGSRALVQLSGSGRAPVLRLETTTVPFTAVAGGEKSGLRAEMTLDTSGELSVEGGRGRILARWPLRLRPDLPPDVAFAAPPQVIAGARLRLPYQMRDDHGVAVLRAVIEREGGDRITVELTVPPAQSGKRDRWQRGAAVLDLASHRWAGLPVTLWLEAVDGREQAARGDSIAITLPERTFNHPVSRELAAIRKRLNDGAPEVRVQAYDALETLSQAPEAFGGAVGIYLGLAVAKTRLYADGAALARRWVQDLLWDMALALEDGGLSLAARDVERLQRALGDALRADPNSDATHRLMDALQNALDRYLAALTQQLQQQGFAEILSGMNADVIGSDQLRDLLERARELAQAGDMDGAQRLLSQLNEMMEALRGGLENSPGAKALQRARRMMQTLGKLTEKQSKLHQDTFQRVREREREDTRLGRTQARTDPLTEEAQRQQDLAGDVRDLSAQMSEILGAAPPSLGDAARAMNDAAGALSGGQGTNGVTAQAKAVEALRKALGEAGQAMARKLGGIGLGQGQGRGAAPNAFGGDPFGRGPGPGGLTGGDIKVPGATERGRVRRLLDELRRRASQPDRPAVERDYINRLLKRF